MSFLLSCFIRSIVALFFFTTTDLQATSSKVHKANKLVQNAHSFIAPFLETKDHEIYSNDITYVENFPITSYKLISVPFQGKFYVDEIDDSIKNHLRKKMIWEPNNQSIISQYVKPGSTVLDIGAHIGTHTVTMSKCVGPKGKVIAFEPSQHIYRELVYNLVANHCKNVLPIRIAVGKDKRVVDVIISHPRNQGGSYVINSQGGANRAVLLPLDALNLNNISFIKIDVENMEADVLDGAISTIKRNRPIMLVEIQGNGERPIQLGENTEEMAHISIEKIRSLGYNLVQINNSADYFAFPET